MKSVRERLFSFILQSALSLRMYILSVIKPGELHIELRRKLPIMPNS